MMKEIESDKYVYCIIPTFNRKDCLKNIINQLNKQTYQYIKIMVVDDGSSDGTGEYLASLGQDNLSVLNGSGSLWWGGAIAKGIKNVLESALPTEYILLLNDDSMFCENYIEEMVRDSKTNGDATVVSPQIQEGSEEIQLTGYKLAYRRMEIYRTREKDIDATVGRGLLVPVSTVNRVGNVKHRVFPHYMGDLEYTARIKEYGFPLVVSEKGKMYSDLTESDGAIRRRGRLFSLLHPRSKVNIQNRILLFTVRGPWRYRLTAIPRAMARGMLGFLRKLNSRSQ